tara:strand:+ start:1834 stop:2382 length:549 start_codon:yes stop_codon:yes gene_type:complete
MPANGLESIVVDLAEPANLWMIFSRGAPPTPTMASFELERYASQTITKTNAGGVADSYTDVLFTASDGTTQLTPATNGVTPTTVLSQAQKAIIISNADAANTIECRLLGNLFTGGAELVDPVVGGGGFITVPVTAGGVTGVGTIRTNRYYKQIRLQARLPAASAAAQTAALTAGLRGYVGSF